MRGLGEDECARAVDGEGQVIGIVTEVGEPGAAHDPSVADDRVERSELRDRALSLDTDPAQERLTRDSGQHTTGIGCDVVLVVELRHVDHENIIRSEDGKVRVVSERQPSLSGQAGELRRATGHPLDDSFQNDPAAACFGPDQGESKLKR